MILKCSECGCSHDDCKASVSPLNVLGVFCMNVVAG